ncbi:UPF0547 protein C16orf87 homolog isoform X1 [Anabrus simplex]|uniref:UPF0547 protein C16orf87 homolog isoform X1 n=1 Tax=Anabrus simplex TaxID=316456 RepID=UPI0034DCCA69
MAKHKMITKSCQKCSSQVPVACKACRCGHPFLTGQRRAMMLAAESRDEGAVQRRRTERVKREKPNYYDALEYDKQQKKQRKRNRSSTDEHVEQTTEDDSHQLKKKNRKRTVKVEREMEEDDVSPLSPEKDYKCSLILSEINRKMCITSWRV